MYKCRVYVYMCSCISHNEGGWDGRNIVSFALMFLMKVLSLEFSGRECENSRDGVPDNRIFSSTSIGLCGSLSNRCAQASGF